MRYKHSRNYYVMQVKITMWKKFMPLTTDEKKLIGQRILFIIKNQGITKDEFAKMHGLKSASNIDNYLRGKSEPDGSFYQSLAKSGIDLNYIIYGETWDAIKKNRSVLPLTQLDIKLDKIESTLRKIIQHSNDPAIVNLMHELS